MNANGVLENFVDDYTYMNEVCDFGILTYTFHPHVIGRGHRMMMLERLIQRADQAGGAVFMTMEARDAGVARPRRRRGGASQRRRTASLRARYDHERAEARAPESMTATRIARQMVTILPIA